MLSASQLDLAFDNDDWTSPQIAPRLYRAASSASTVSSWGVTSIGRGFEWESDDENSSIISAPPLKLDKEDYRLAFDLSDEEEKPRKPGPSSLNIMRPVTNVTPISTTPTLLSASLSSEPFFMSPSHSRPASPITHSTSPGPPTASPRPGLPSRTASIPRPRRRSSQQRVSLIAGRVMIAPRDTPTVPTFEPQYLSIQRANSNSSFISVASTRPPSPTSQESFLGNRNISEFEIEGEIGRGAYGLVKRAREKLSDGSLGVRTFLITS